MSKVSSYTHTLSQLNDFANQKNPNSAAYRARMNNHANQLNPNNPAYRVLVAGGTTILASQVFKVVAITAAVGAGCYLTYKLVKKYQEKKENNIAKDSVDESIVAEAEIIK